MSPILTLTGPTAAGKTALSLSIAASIGAEIVSVDSRQLYRQLSIGTAKPSPEERSRVPHHFIDEWEITEPVSAGIYARSAEERIAEIVARGKTPLVVGGSTLYLSALQRGLADVPDISADVRQNLVTRMEREGADALFRVLERVDPESARTMDPTKTQRIVRALEVYEGTGKPLSAYHAAAIPPAYRYRTVVLTAPRPALYHRIDRRVDEMLEAGLIDEVRGLLEAGYSDNLPALRTIGYQEPIRFLRGEIAQDEMVRLIKRNTRRYAKRQLTWFRRFSDYQWLDVEEASRRPEALLSP